MKQVLFIIAPNIPSWSSGFFHTEKNKVSKKISRKELSSVRENTVLLLDINKQGIESDFIRGPMNDMFIVSKQIFLKVADLINLSDFTLFDCKDSVNLQNEYTLFVRKIEETYLDSICDFGISFINNSFYFSDDLIARLNAINAFGFWVIPRGSQNKPYPYCMTFKELQNKAKEICEYAKVFTKILKITDDDPRIEEIAFQDDYPVSIIFQENPTWTWEYISFYEYAAIAMKKFLDKNPDSAKLVAKAWEKNTGSKQAPVLKVTKNELESDPVAVFVQAFLTKINSIDFPSKNHEGLSSVKEMFDMISKCDIPYSTYKTRLYELYRTIAQIASRYSKEDLESINELLKLQNISTISSLIQSDVYFEASYFNKPLDFYYCLPKNDDKPLS